MPFSITSIYLQSIVLVPHANVASLYPETYHILDGSRSKTKVGPLELQSQGLGSGDQLLLPDTCQSS
jgi:hypothetical protein